MVFLMNDLLTCIHTHTVYLSIFLSEGNQTAFLSELISATFFISQKVADYPVITFYFQSDLPPGKLLDNSTTLQTDVFYFSQAGCKLSDSDNYLNLDPCVVSNPFAFRTLRFALREQCGSLTLQRHHSALLWCLFHQRGQSNTRS